MRFDSLVHQRHILPAVRTLPWRGTGEMLLDSGERKAEGTGCKTTFGGSLLKKSCSADTKACPYSLVPFRDRVPQPRAKSCLSHQRTFPAASGIHFALGLPLLWVPHGANPRLPPDPPSSRPGCPSCTQKASWGPLLRCTCRG